MACGDCEALCAALALNDDAPMEEEELEEERELSPRLETSGVFVGRDEREPEVEAVCLAAADCSELKGDLEHCAAEVTRLTAVTARLRAALASAQTALQAEQLRGNELAAALADAG